MFLDQDIIYEYQGQTSRCEEETVTPQRHSYRTPTVHRRWLRQYHFNVTTRREDVLRLEQVFRYVPTVIWPDLASVR